MRKIKLFCLPYAGGSAIVYKKWEAYLHDEVELVAIELAGRGRRSGEPLYKNVEEAVNDAYSIIAAEIVKGTPYAIYGHSMGAMLAYEVLQKITENSLPQPLHAFFMGRGAPHIKSKKEKLYHTMEKEEFQKAVMNLGGTPKEFFEHPELMDYLLPILKNDFKIAEIGVNNPVIKPLNFNITVFMGKEEEFIAAENVHGWMLHTNQNCTVHYFNGGHFFVNDAVEEVVGIIHKVLSKKTATSRLLI